MHSVTKLLGGLCAMAGLASASLAYAQEAPSSVSTPANLGEPEVMSLAELGELSGGTGVTAVITDQDLVAINHDNTVTGDVVGSGDINLSHGALGGFNGIGNFVMNTGHNNNLQSSLSVSILLDGGAGS